VGSPQEGFTVIPNAAEGMVPLLHIDDNRDDRLLVREAISLSQTPLAFYEAGDIDSAIPYFQFEKDGQGAEEFPRPALVLLDYDLGRQTGADFLHWLRVMKKMVSIPIVMFSGSVGRRNVAECYEQGANFFLRKAADLTSLKRIVRCLHLSIQSKIPGPIFRLPEYEADPRSNGATVANVS
jgi:CheY-like chemotaxis protein